MQAIPYIRWSDQHQSRGSSLKRQRDAIEAFCDEMEWPVAKPMIDDGKSAFTGENMDAGVLSDFSQRIKREGGEGIVLVVERMNRLSRRDTFDVILWIAEMVAQGLTIALVDIKMIVDAASLRNQRPQLRKLVEEGDAANDYAQNLSSFVRPAWQAMRDGKDVIVEHNGTIKALTVVGDRKDVTRIDIVRGEGAGRTRGTVDSLWVNEFRESLSVGDALEAGQTIGTIRKKVHTESTCPAWLELIENRTTFRALHDRVAVLKRIFAMYVAGKGARTIAVILNKEGEETFRGGRCWHGSTIKALISNRGVIGSYEHHVERKANGHVVEDYFPAVVDFETFQAANDERHKRIMSNHSRTSRLRNLFSDVAKCMECGGKLTMVTKRVTPEGRFDAYLQCQNSYLGNGCSSRKSIRTMPIEDTVLDNVLTLAMDDQHFADVDSAAEIRRELADHKRALDDIQRKLEALADLVMEPTFRRDDRFDVRYRTAQHEETAALAALKDCQARYQAAQGMVTPGEHIRRVAEIRADLWHSDEAIGYEARRKVKLAINDIVESMIVSVEDEQICVLLKGSIRALVMDWNGKLTGDAAIWRDHALPNEAQPVHDYFRRKSGVTGTRERGETCG